jgi:hypothetical protein
MIVETVTQNWRQSKEDENEYLTQPLHRDERLNVLLE